MNEAERFLESHRKERESDRSHGIQSPDVHPQYRAPDTNPPRAQVPGWFALEGRIRRKTYFWRLICIAAGIFTASLLIGLWYGTTLIGALPAGADFEAIIESAGSQIGVLVMFLSLPFMIPQDTKRLHDLNMSGWNQLIFLIPLLGWIFRLYVLFRRGTIGPNNYGQQPA